MVKKKSLVDKFVNKVSKMCSSGSTEEIKTRGLESQGFESDDDEEEDVVNVNSIKMRRVESGTEERRGSAL